MKTLAAISALTVVGSIAFAAGQSRQAPIAGDEQPVEFVTAMSGGGSCDQFALPEDPWFAPVLNQIQACPGFPSLPSTFTTDSLQQDVNGDGKTDYFYAVISTNLSTTSSFNWVVAHQTYDTVVGTQSRERFVAVLSRQTVLNALLQVYPGTSSTFINKRLWRDMDGDGDMDFVMTFTTSSGGSPIQGWFENIGYEKSDPPVAADLNQDGAVDGVDLGMLLSAWGTVD